MSEAVGGLDVQGLRGGSRRCRYWPSHGQIRTFNDIQRPFGRWAGSDKTIHTAINRGQGATARARGLGAPTKVAWGRQRVRRGRACAQRCSRILGAERMTLRKYARRAA
eukprot:442004-Pleurochrysis_carterae.AAC.1